MMRKTMCTALFLVACGENPADTTPDAQIIDPAQPEAAASNASEAPAGQKALSGHVYFTGSNLRSSHTCRFDTWSGSFLPGTGGAIDSLSLEFTVETSSVFCDWESKPDGVPRLEKHLRSDDFFHAEAHPQARFVSTQIAASEAGGFEVTGDFTLRGVTKTIRFPAQISWENGAFNAEAKFDIRRTDWDVKYTGAADNLIREEVVLDILLKG